MTDYYRQYAVLKRMIGRHGLTDAQKAEALILFFHAPDFGFCKAARFVWQARNGRGPVDAAAPEAGQRVDAGGK